LLGNNFKSAVLYNIPQCKVDKFNIKNKVKTGSIHHNQPKVLSDGIEYQNGILTIHSKELSSDNI
jgi:hypothetical protein